MARARTTALLSMLLAASSGCYLFSDEPKARKGPAAGKQGEGEDASKDQAPDEGDEGDGGVEAPTPEGQVEDCPEVLTGTETQARTLASSCASVRVRGEYRIDGGSLTIEPGVELRFEAGAVLEVGRSRPGSLIVAGSAEQPVRFVADHVGEAGRWQGLRLHPQAAETRLENLEIRGAGDASAAALEIAAPAVKIRELKLAGAVGLALEIRGEGGVDLLGAEIEGAGSLVRASPKAAAGLQDLRLSPGAKVAITAGRVDGTLEWPANDYRVEGVVEIQGEEQVPAQLSLSPNSRLAFAPGARLIVGGLGPGSLLAAAPLDGELPEIARPDPELDEPAGPFEDGSIRLVAAPPSPGQAGAPTPGSWAGVELGDGGHLSLRGVELAYGGERGAGVIVAEGEASVAIEGCEFHDNLVGVELRGAEVELERFAANVFTTTPVALRLSPELLGALGEGNSYDLDARIELERGKVVTDTRWDPGEALVVVGGDVFVDKDAKLTVAPGTRLAFAPGVKLGVGYYGPGSLDMRATADAPITLGPKPGGAAEPWGGIVLGTHARDVRFEHLRLHATGGAAGIELRDAAEATLVHVDCRDCAGATVRWDCASQIGNIAVSASGTTPTALLPPTACK